MAGEAAEAKPLVPEGPDGLFGARIGKEAIHLRAVTLVGVEHAVAGRVEQLVVGHALPEGVAELARDLVAGELEGVVGALEGDAVQLQVVEELRREHEGDDHRADRLGGRAHAVVELGVAGALLGVEVAAEHAATEGGEEVVDARLRKRGLRRAVASDGFEERGVGLDGVADRGGDVEVAGHVLGGDAVVEALEGVGGVAGDRAEERLDGGGDRRQAAHLEQVPHGVAVLDRRELHERRFAGLGLGGQGGLVGVAVAIANVADATARVGGGGQDRDGHEAVGAWSCSEHAHHVCRWCAARIVA
ncbi:MAG: hypothetical protein RIF41_12525 [Polyangiaceae bacterium]